MPTPLHVLILEDNPDDAELMVDSLHEAGFAPVWQRVATESDYLAHLHARLDVILADYPYSDTYRTYARNTKIYGCITGCFPSSLATVKLRFYMRKFGQCTQVSL